MGKLIMLINLQEETQEYWRELDKLENAYNEGKISIEEVDAEVHFLMAEMGRKRRRAISDFWQILKIWLTQQKEMLISLTILGTIVYLWLISKV